MSTLPPVATNWLPELHDGKDPYSPVGIKLINQLRRRILGGSVGLGLALFSSALGRGDSTNTTSGNEDQFILQMQLPSVFPTFSFSMGCMLLSSTTGSPTVRARIGGSWNVFDGNIIASFGFPVGTPANTLAHSSTTGNLVTLNTGTLLKLTLQSAAPGVKATAVGSFVIGS
jgi:hypothetical protein